MTNHKREELIERATWALIDYDTGVAGRGVSDEHYRERRADVERVWAVFEQADTPSDDERKTLAEAIRRGSGASRYQSELLADQALPHLAGFRHTAVQEPQGEPSDAVVIHALEAYWGPTGFWFSGQIKSMRAALRAAALAEESEWEWGSEGKEGTSDPDPRPLEDDRPYWPKHLTEVRELTREQAESVITAWNEGDPDSSFLIRRRKAGPWMPVKQEGENP